MAKVTNWVPWVSGTLAMGDEDRCQDAFHIRGKRIQCKLRTGHRGRHFSTEAGGAGTWK